MKTHDRGTKQELNIEGYEPILFCRFPFLGSVCIATSDWISHTNGMSVLNYTNKHATKLSDKMDTV